MVATLLPMSAFAGIYDYDVTHPYETRYVLRGSQYLRSRTVDGSLFAGTRTVYSNWKYSNGDDIETANLECVVVTMEPRKKVIFAEPGSKFLITAGDINITGGSSNFKVNDGLGTSKSINFPIESQFDGLTNTFREANYVPVGSVSATYGTDFMKGWRGNLASRNGRLIEIKPDAVCDPEHPHVVKVKGEWTAGATGYVYIVIASKQDIVNMVAKDTQKHSSDPIYSVDLTCLGDSRRIPSEPSTVSGRDWWKFYPSGDTLKLAYNKSGDGLTQLNRVKVSLKNQHYANNALTAGIIKTDVFTTLPGYTSSFDGSNTGGIADATGVKTKAALNLTDADYQAMLDWLYSLARATASSTTKASFDTISNRYFLKAGKDSGTADNLNTLYTADKKNLADISSTDIAKYEVIPYVVKLQTQKNTGWKVDCAIVPKAEYRVQYIYDLNTPQGLALEGLAAPSGDVALVNESLFVDTIEAPTYLINPGTDAESRKDLVAGQEYTFYDINDNAIRVRFNGWTLDNASTPVYTPGQFKDLTSPVPRLYTFKGNWTVLNETVEVKKEVQGTDAEDVDFTFTFNFEDGQSHNAYVVDKYGIPVGLNEEDGSHPSSNLSNGSTMNLKAGQSIYIENVNVGTDVTVTEESMPNDDYCSRNPSVVITPDGQPSQTASGYYVYEQDDKIVNLYGSYYVVHSSDPTATAIKMPITDTNIVEDVYDGYLYGGYYTDSSYAADKIGKVGPGNNFEPEAGATYYLKEINDYYARTSCYVTYQPNYAGKPITGLSLITAMDNNNYGEIGFILSSVDGTSKATAFGQELKATRGTGEEAKVVGTYALKNFFSALGNKIADADTYTDPAKGETAVVTAVNIDKGTASGTNVATYYKTLDNVTVYGKSVYTLTNTGSKTGTSFAKNPDLIYNENGFVTPGSEGNGYKAKMSLMPARVKAMAPADVQSEPVILEPLPVYKTIVIGEDDPVGENMTTLPDATEVEVQYPEEPETPETPETPDVSNDIVISKIDGADVSEMTVEPGNYTGKVEPAAKDGYVFAGWYLDSKYTTPADFSNVTENMIVYAKYIKASNVSVSVSKASLLKNNFKATISVKDASFDTAVLNYSINGKGGSIDCNASGSKFVCNWSAAIKTGNKLVVAPSFVTADGTVVICPASTFTYVLGLFI